MVQENNVSAPGKAAITVIMGIYNCADTLVEALDSLMAQTCQDFHVVMCDDASTDDTLRVAREYAQRHPGKFTVITNPVNLRLGATLNRCLELADTPFVARMDGDDVSMPERFAKELAYLQAHPQMDIVSTMMTHFDSGGAYHTPPVRAGRDVRLEDFVGHSPFCHAPCMVRTQAYRRVNGYDAAATRVEDYDLWCRMWAAGSRGHNLGEPLYAMRDDRNATHRRTFRSRLTEAKYKYRGLRLLGFGLRTRLTALRPVVLGLLPAAVYERLHRRKLAQRK